ncbi:hypothetical protein V1264_001080 [Littorina saxatilis]|uniref:COX assembly mitochondrial protein n=1 Tax=Littorina saxatilis TaxID=31220 RepID=A0AAN9BYP0_9CAEN
MHPDLAAHLHSPECNALIDALKRCHEEHSVRMYMGFCNDMERAMTKCLKQERLERRRLNRIKAKDMQERIRENQKHSSFVPPDQ